MLKFRYFTLVALVVLLALSACSSNKKIEVVPEPVISPMALAHAAAEEAADLYEDGMLEQAIGAFTTAIKLFENAAPTATESDSLDYNIESMKLNVAKTHIDMAQESIDMSMYNEAITHYEAALKMVHSTKGTPLHLNVL